jgi:hypothetical protein
MKIYLQQSFDIQNNAHQLVGIRRIADLCESKPINQKQCLGTRHRRLQTHRRAD